MTIRVLTFTSLFPNAEMPSFGVFVENRLRHLVAEGQVEARVVAPCPWFPSSARVFGRWAAWARVPRLERRGGIEVRHPRFPLLPKVGTAAAPLCMYAGSLGPVERLRRAWDFDVIDAHYLYPDGVAAVLLGRRLGKPVVLTARGSDVMIIPRHPAARRWILWAAERADGLAAVSAALRDRLVALGVPADKPRVLRNGVDTRLFRPLERAAARRALGLPEGPVLAMVGNLVPVKDHRLAFAALALLPEATLVVVGDGGERRRLRALADGLGIGDRVRFLGTLPHDRLAPVYSAADALLLTSRSEGWPNVLLEAMACGTPAVATAVSGVPEIIAGPAAGRLVGERRPEAVAAAVRALLADPPSRSATRAYAEGFGWEQTARGQVALFRSVIARRAGQRAVSLP